MVQKFNGGNDKRSNPLSDLMYVLKANSQSTIEPCLED